MVQLRHDAYVDKWARRVPWVPGPIRFKGNQIMVLPIIPKKDIRVRPVPQRLPVAVAGNTYLYANPKSTRIHASGSQIRRKSKAKGMRAR